MGTADPDRPNGRIGILATVSVIVLSALLYAALHPNLFRNRDTCLCVAASKGDIGEVRRLLSMGADVNGTRSRGFSKWHRSVTPLHFAAHAGDAAIVRLLLERGADPQRRSASGQTPLDFATSESIRKLLLETKH